MTLWKEKNRRQAVYLLTACLIFSMGLTFFATFLSYKNYCARVNNAVSMIIFEIQSQYPAVEEEALLHILNNREKKSSLTLSDFGIQEDTINILKNMKQSWYDSILYFLPVTAILGLLAAGVLILYFSQENKKLLEITEYIHAIYDKKYDLCLQENEEGTISILKNELYKITIMLKEQAERSQKEKEAMKDSMTDISHQIKTPMTSVLILLDNLRDHTMPEETQHKFLSEINRQIVWVNSLVISLLKLSKLDAGIVKMIREKIFLYEIFTEIKESLSILIEAKNIVVSIQENKEIFFLGDRYWEREALTNLLKNAAEHTPPGKEVHVSFEENYFYTVVMIEDQGEGINEEEQRRIFERFYRGKHSSPDGVGIGLSLAKKIIEQDHGTIKILSKKGKGSTFFVRYTKQFYSNR